MSEDISEIAKCPVCWQSYTSDEAHAPVTLLCGHTFCRDCIAIAEREHGNLRCLYCCARSWQSTNQLNKNWQLTELLQKLSALRNIPTTETCESQPKVDNTPNRENNVAVVSGTPATRNAMMDEAIEIVGSIQRMIDTTMETLNRLNLIIEEYPGDLRQLNNVIVNIFMILRNLAYHQLYHRIGSILSRNDFLIQMPGLVGMNNDMIEDIQMQAVILAQIQGRNYVPPIQQANAQQNMDEIAVVLQAIRRAELDHGRPRRNVRRDVGVVVQNPQPVENVPSTASVSSGSSAGSELQTAASMDANGNELRRAASAVNTAIEGVIIVQPPGDQSDSESDVDEADDENNG